ncbi:hypothetical protein EV356DRAFT_528949 [Viridothelium virens]|uniref:Uncharacterized protein n=1 Tax=Viridothelium virens TaxID=1048519 RepID=A0A6A6HKZ4_VIRVR|nr:hypothetical protein EV356DRAFT_528949 [Viridothelium virens]
MKINRVVPDGNELRIYENPIAPESVFADFSANGQRCSNHGTFPSSEADYPLLDKATEHGGTETVQTGFTMRKPNRGTETEESTYPRSAYTVLPEHNIPDQGFFGGERAHDLKGGQEGRITSPNSETQVAQAQQQCEESQIHSEHQSSRPRVPSAGGHHTRLG